MPTNDSPRTGFRIADGPILGKEPAPDFSDLPKPFGAPLLFAIARDPRTLFTYWNIDWPAAFAGEEPLDRQVFLRVLKESGAEESECVVEPMLGSYYALVARPRESYRVELGFYGRAGNWRSVAISDAVAMPAESVSENTVVDVATVPFHLSFQKMIDLFCETNGDPLTTVLSRVQARALAEEDVDLAPEEREILRAMNLSVNQLRSASERFASRSDDAMLRKRAEAILGFGSSSPMQGFGGSSGSAS
jgi:hypothetical protein